jgi:hypothetical protein
MQRTPLIISVLAIAAIAWGIRRSANAPPPLPPIARPTPSTTSAPATIASTEPQPPHDFMSLVLQAYPEFPSTQPLPIPAELHEGARLILHDPIYLDSFGDLWITRPDAPPTQKIFKSITDDQVHLTREHVLFVHHFLDDSQEWQPQIIAPDADGSFVLISADSRLNLGKRYAYHWDRAFDWNSTTNEGFVVPTDTGVSIFRPRSLPVELHFDFAGPTTAPSTDASAPAPLAAGPQVLLDMRGLLAWIPWNDATPGSHGAARFVDGKWQPLGPDQGWPEKILHLIPLVGGGVLQLIQNDDGTVTQSLGQLDAAPIDHKLVDPLIQQLSDPDPTVRDAASAQLTRYGPGLWPILEKELDDQPPEGQLRIQRLLAAKQNPTFGPMTLLPGNVRVVSHLQDGGVLLVADAGITVPANDPAQPPLSTVPAYITIRPGQPIALAPPALVQDLPPDAHFDIAPDEWIETDSTRGPCRLLGNHLEPLLCKSELQFSQFVGIDRKGRWLFRQGTFEKPTNSTAPTAASPASAGTSSGYSQPNQPTPTLVLDPNLPDATPRLAAWNQPVQCDAVGWDDANWPVVVKGDDAWGLHAEEWSPLPAPPARKFYKSMDDIPPAPTPTTATTQPAPILKDSDGSAYFDGADKLELHRPDGSVITWPLPTAAVGTGEVHLLRTPDNHLFLFNEPGRLLRIVPTPKAREPFKLEATFTRQIPNAHHFTRIWLDPAGRIDLESDPNHLTILYPDGRIPRAISEKMPEEQLKDDEE